MKIKHDNPQIPEIVTYLQQGLKFGLFNAGASSGGRYYFENGKYVKTDVLWEAVRLANNLEVNHGKTLKELCKNYTGEFKHKVTAHTWRKNRRRYLGFF